MIGFPPQKNDVVFRLVPKNKYGTQILDRIIESIHDDFKDRKEYYSPPAIPTISRIESNFDVYFNDEKVEFWDGDNNYRNFWDYVRLKPREMFHYANFKIKYSDKVDLEFYFRSVCVQNSFTDIELDLRSYEIVYLDLATKDFYMIF